MRALCLEEIERKEREIGELKMNGMDEMAESLAFRHEHDVFPGVMTMADALTPSVYDGRILQALPRDDLCRRGGILTDVILALFSGN